MHGGGGDIVENPKLDATLRYKNLCRIFFLLASRVADFEDCYLLVEETLHNVSKQVEEKKSEKLLKLMLKILVFKYHSAYLNSLQMLLVLRRKKNQMVGQNGRNLGLKNFRRKRRTKQIRRQQRKLHNMKKVQTLCKNSKHMRKT